MAQLITLLSTGQGTWSEVAQLLNKPEFDEIFILTNTFGKDKFTNLPQKKIEVLVFNFENPDISKLSSEIALALRNKLSFNDVAVNISSGTGKEHMAVLSAIMKVGVGMRIVSIKDGNVIEL